MTTSPIVASVVLGLMAVSAPAQEHRPTVYYALRCPAPEIGSTWGIWDRDGASRKVDRYLSSLPNGESATGMISSPPFMIEVDTITFTLCGHDGPTGGRGENYIALVDARKGQILLKTPAPQNDAMQERSWDVRGLRGNQVRIEVHDGNSGSGFAWLGVGRIDAGPALQIDFRNGMPAGWAETRRTTAIRYETLRGGVPFQRAGNVFSLISPGKTVEIPCGFRARRLFFLGMTAAGVQPLQECGSIEIHYRGGGKDVIPLLAGFTIDAAYKLLSPAKTLHLHPSADPFQHYLAVQPRDQQIESIRLVPPAPDSPLPRITAITCETNAPSEHLMPLPETTLTPREAEWIATRTVRAESIDLDAVRRAIREVYRMPPSQ